MDFKNVVFTDECRATLDGTEAWSSGWVLNGRPVGSQIRRQKGGGGVMFWAGIKGNEIIGPFRVPQGVKLIQRVTASFLRTSSFPGWKIKL